MRSCWCCLLTFLLLQELPALHGMDTHLMPPELTIRLMDAALTKGSLRPVPITKEVFGELKSGPFPGEQCDGVPCRVPFSFWYCYGLCKSMQALCQLPSHDSNTFCHWCEEQGCFASSESTTDTPTDPDYFEMDYSEIAVLDPK